MNVALTGSRGFIGSHLKTRLEKDGHKVIEWDLRQDPPQCIKDFDPKDEIHFFGDRMDEDGNDYPLAEALKEMDGSTHYVTGWEDTRTRLVEFSASGEFFK